MHARLDSPVGPLSVAASAAGLTHVLFGARAEARGDGSAEAARHLEAACAQLEAYFAGLRRTFELTLAPAGTSFQRAVWRALEDIPFGQTITYAELARRIGRPQAVRAVGAANGKNPISIVVPCHRVIGADGTLTGYGGGLEVKARLLAHEGRRQGSQAELPF